MSREERENQSFLRRLVIASLLLLIGAARILAIIGII